MFLFSVPSRNPHSFLGTPRWPADRHHDAPQLDTYILTNFPSFLSVAQALQLRKSNFYCLRSPEFRSPKADDRTRLSLLVTSQKKQTPLFFSQHSSSVAPYLQTPRIRSLHINLPNAPPPSASSRSPTPNLCRLPSSSSWAILLFLNHDRNHNQACRRYSIPPA